MTIPSEEDVYNAVMDLLETVKPGTAVQIVAMAIANIVRNTEHESGRDVTVEELLETIKTIANLTLKQGNVYDISEIDIPERLLN